MTHPIVKALDSVPSNTALAAFLGVSKQTLTSMGTKAKTDKKFLTPSKHALKIAQVAGLKPHAVRPDLYVRDWDVPAVVLGADGKVKRPSKPKAPKASATSETVAR